MNAVELDVQVALSPIPDGRHAPTWVSLKQYAANHQIHYNTAVKWLKEGLLVSYREKRVIRVKNQPPQRPNQGEE